MSKLCLPMRTNAPRKRCGLIAPFPILATETTTLSAPLTGIGESIDKPKALANLR